MHKLWLVIKREYITRVRTKAFVIGTIAIPLFTIGIFAVSIFMQTQQTDHTLKIAILDDVGGLANPITRGLTTEKLKNGQPAFEVAKSVEHPALGRCGQPLERGPERQPGRVSDGSEGRHRRERFA